MVDWARSGSVMSGAITGVAIGRDQGGGFLVSFGDDLEKSVVWAGVRGWSENRR